MSLLDAREISKSFAARAVLDRVSLTLREGERAGLIGNNGSGKSTLGRILAGVDSADSGKLTRRRGTRVDYLPQEPRLPGGHSARQVVIDSLEEWTQARRRYDDLTRALAEGGGDVERLAQDQAEAAEELERCGGWERLHEADAVISHLGIRDPERRIDELSGGEIRRVALARVLVGQPDLAILDEPTNHLDAATIEWLEDFLRERFRGALLLISHDRYLLDRCTTRTLELEAGTLFAYSGGYAHYLEAKAERQAHAERAERNRQNFLRRELDWLRRQPKARGTKQKARIGRAESAIDTAAPLAERSVDLRLDAQRVGKTILEISGLSLERDGQLLIDGFDLSLGRAQRIGVVGPNGCGKTSLLLVVLGQLAATSGEVTRGETTLPGYLDQARSGLDDRKTVRESVAEGGSDLERAGQRMSVGGHLERFLFARDAQRVKVGELSGGERARVCLAKLLWQKTNLLLLDEPTNDLDVSTLAALEAMLSDYAGSGLIVSHDRWFLDRVATSILAFEGAGRLELHPGNYSQYRERMARRAESVPAVEPAAPKARQRTGPTPRKKLSFKEERELAGLFEQIEQAEIVVEGFESRLADPETYKRDGASVAGLQREAQEARERAEALTARWEELEAKQAAAGLA